MFATQRGGVTRLLTKYHKLLVNSYNRIRAPSILLSLLLALFVIIAAASLINLLQLVNISWTTALQPDIESFHALVDANLYGTPVIVDTIDERVDPEETSILWPNGCPDETSASLPTCSSPLRRIFLLKTHKCASSTISALVTRFGLKQNTTFALPRHELAHINWPSLLRPSAIWGYEQLRRAGIELEMLSQHTAYERCTVRKLFPKDRTAYVTILREPLAQLRSTLYYFVEFSTGTIGNSKDRRAEFLHNRYTYPKTYPITYDLVHFGDVYFTRNFMSTDLGFPPSQFHNENAIQLFIERLDKDFDLIMIAEAFYESLVLFRRLVCWQFKDMIFVSLNANTHYTNTGEQQVTPEMITISRSWSKVDHAIYDHFNKTFWAKILSQQNGFHEEVAQLKNATEKVSEFCSTKNQTNKLTLKMAASKWGDAFELTNDDCQIMLIQPHEWTPVLWARMAKRLQYAS